MWDLPGPGIKSISPALAGRFFTTEPPFFFFLKKKKYLIYLVALGLNCSTWDPVNTGEAPECWTGSHSADDETYGDDETYSEKLSKFISLAYF